VNDLEARLVDVDVSRCTCTVGDGTGSANIGVDIAAAPDGVIRTRGRTLGFRRAEGSGTWGATVDLTNSPTTVTQYTKPADVARLLTQLLKLETPPDDYIAAPPVLPGLTLRAHLNTAKAVKVEVTDLQLMVIYSCRPAVGLRGVRVTTRSGGADAPTYFVSRPDESGAQHGFREFTRLYAGPQPVYVVAPTFLGEEHFVGWYTQGTLSEPSTRLTLPAKADSYAYEARYAP
jgi:hypothetical protein